MIKSKYKNQKEKQMPDQTNLSAIQSILQNSTAGTEEFSNAFAQLKHLIQTGNLDAALFLTWFYLQKGEIKDATKKSYQLCNQIVQGTGHPVAMERMASILLWGVGVEKNEAKSFQLYQQLAMQGVFPLTSLAYLHSQGIGTVADECMASSLILKSAAQGDTLAFMLLSYRYEVGLGVPINGLVARAYAILAGKRGFPGSKQRMKKLRESFVEIGQTQVEELAGKLINNIEILFDKTDELSRKINQQSPKFVRRYMDLISENFALLNLSDLSLNSVDRGYKIQQREPIESVSKIIQGEPLIMITENFATFEECQYLIDQAIPLLESTEKQTQRNSTAEVDAFSGDSAILSSRQNSPIDRIIQQRHATIESVPVTHFEPISLLKYSVGHEYSMHTDAFDDERINMHEQKGDFGGQRMSVNLLYLLPADVGGETFYKNLDLKISGEIGTSIIHHNATDDFKPDMRSLHAGLEIVKGEKWLLRTATRQYPLYGTNKVDI